MKGDVSNGEVPGRDLSALSHFDLDGMTSTTSDHVSEDENTGSFALTSAFNCSVDLLPS